MPKLNKSKTKQKEQNKSESCKHCKLRNNNEMISAWIPAKLAKLGKIVEISSEKGKWIVSEIWPTIEGQEQTRSDVKEG